MEEEISNDSGSNKSCWKPWRWIFRLDEMKDICISSKPTHKTQEQSVKSLKISLPETFSDNHEDCLHPCEKNQNSFEEIQWKLGQQHDHFPQRGSLCRTNTNVRNKYEWTELWESQPKVGAGKLTMWIISYGVEKI